jgi:hypothetical protein
MYTVIHRQKGLPHTFHNKKHHVCVSWPCNHHNRHRNCFLPPPTHYDFPPAVQPPSSLSCSSPASLLLLPLRQGQDQSMGCGSLTILLSADNRGIPWSVSVSQRSCRSTACAHMRARLRVYKGRPCGRMVYIRAPHMCAGLWMLVGPGLNACANERRVCAHASAYARKARTRLRAHTRCG